MVEFLSLFLGLILGVQPVAVAVDGHVASVTLVLDGQVVGQMDEAPWRTKIDFGDALRPRRLEAIAFDAAGKPISRTQQLVNFARRTHEASLALEEYEEDGGRRGRVIWRAVLSQDPNRIALRFDGTPISVEPGGTFRLPPHDLERLHVLEATLTFPDGYVAMANLSYGGDLGDRLTTALTAVPISHPPGKPWSTSQVEGWLEKDGRPVPVFGARAEPGSVVVVHDRELGRVQGEVRKKLRKLRPIDLGPPEHYDYRITLAASEPLVDHPGNFEMVDLGRLEPERGILGLALTAPRKLPFEQRRRGGRLAQKLWESLAVAGREAASTNRPRAVVVLLASVPSSRVATFGTVRESSRFSQEHALAYLDSLRVPVFVWASDNRALLDFRLAEYSRSYRGPEGLVKLVKDVSQELSSQTIIWLEGQHLPWELELADSIPDSVELVR